MTPNVLARQGITDLAEIGDAMPADPELDRRLHQLFHGVEKTKARYKIGLYFTGDRSARAPYKGFITLWTAGNDVGDGDRSLYLCPQLISHGDRVRPCNAPLEYGMFTSQGAVCAKCRRHTKRDDLTGQIFARLTTQHWTVLVTRVFGILGCNADISVSYFQTDIRRETARTDERGTRDALTQHRQARTEVVYTLARLIRDTSSGATVESAVRAFLEA